MRKSPIRTTPRHHDQLGFMEWFLLSALLVGIGRDLGYLVILILLIFYLSDPVRFTRSRNRKEKGMGGSDEIGFPICHFPWKAPIAGLLSEAEKWMRLGDYSKAIVYLFSHILIELDEHRRIRLQRGKTNGMYLRELGRWPEWRGAIRKVVTAFERSFFGGHR